MGSPYFGLSLHCQVHDDDDDDDDDDDGNDDNADSCLFYCDDDDAGSVLVFFRKHGNEGMDLALKRQANVTKLSSFIIEEKNIEEEKNKKHIGWKIGGLKSREYHTKPNNTPPTPQI